MIRDIARQLPQTVEALRAWDGQGIPDEAVFAALVVDLKTAQKEKTAALIGKRLNYEISGIRSKIIATARKVEKLEVRPLQGGGHRDGSRLGRTQYLGHDQTLAARHHAEFYLLAAFDLEINADGALAWVPANRAIYVTVLTRTFCISIQVTTWTLLLGFPCRLPAGDAADTHMQLADDPRAAAVLDVAAGANDGLVRAAAGLRRHQRLADVPAA